MGWRRCLESGFFLPDSFFGIRRRTKVVSPTEEGRRGSRSSTVALMKKRKVVTFRSMASPPVPNCRLLEGTSHECSYLMSRPYEVALRA